MYERLLMIFMALLFLVTYGEQKQPERRECGDGCEIQEGGKNRVSIPGIVGEGRRLEVVLRFGGNED